MRARATREKIPSLMVSLLFNLFTSRNIAVVFSVKHGRTKFVVRLNAYGEVRATLKPAEIIQKFPYREMLSPVREKVMG